MARNDPTAKILMVNDVLPCERGFSFFAQASFCQYPSYLFCMATHLKGRDQEETSRFPGGDLSVAGSPTYGSLIFTEQ